LKFWLICLGNGKLRKGETLILTNVIDKWFCIFIKTKLFFEIVGENNYNNFNSLLILMDNFKHIVGLDMISWKQ